VISLDAASIFQVDAGGIRDIVGLLEEHEAPEAA
jgi:hypothetical protein